MKTKLLIGLLLCGGAFGANPAAGQTPRPAPKTASNVSLMPVVGVAKEAFLRSLVVRKGGVRASSTAQPQDCVNGTPTIQGVACGSTTSGQLANTDCFIMSDNSYYDVYSFDGTSGQQVTITMSSSAFDTYLFLIDPSGSNTAATDHDGGGGTTSRIVFPLNQTGTWFVVANSNSGNQFGAYTLALQCSAAPPPGSCTADATTLCLNNGRFRVQATYTTPAGQSGPGMAVPQTSDTGLFWFFTANNIEVIIKVVNACTFAAAPRYWVFAGGLTNVQVALTVTDTSNGTARNYTNPQNTAFAPIQDTDAFATCP
ncbi:MAG TPA: PPC domain-containing protein [Thermoanaerobaculia bacterium]